MHHTHAKAPRLTVCVPAYEMQGRGAAYLDQLLHSLQAQSYPHLDVVIADQSRDGSLAELCAAWADRLTLTRIDTSDVKRCASANINRALDAATGDIAKVLFQDDFLCAPDALARIAQAMTDSDAAWCLCGSGVTRNGTDIEAPMRPRLNPGLHLGHNTVSSPSVLALRRSCPERFDEDLEWLMDVEFYHRLALTYGPPALVDEVLVANRLHDGQVSARIDRRIKARELDAVIRRHRGTTSLAGKLEYAKRRIKTLWPV